ncbi:MAG: AraC family transcriptional regulator [Roseibium sp.]|uniref:helix-turn-helix domain-containing protein n=1 Tax=Roseibium sp. TaxID=1936156 RepID=UPI00262C9D80|nr:AraC family transcriptional regulator [Roseibium sp.]MCV0427081.1 AraC family transcriptional regulator [Roseibium sp.]
MISIPVSFLLAAIFFCLGLGAFSWQRLPLLSRLLFLVLFSLMAMEAVLVGFRFALGNLEFLAIQRVLPVWIAPAAYLAFAVMAKAGAQAYRAVAFHEVIAVAFTLAMFMPAPFVGYVDALIAASFAVYSALLFRLWWLGPDHLSEVATNLHDLLRRLLGLAILVLISTMLIDVLIAFLFAQELDDAAAITISVVSLLFLALAFVVVIISLKVRLYAQLNQGKGTAEDTEGSELLVDAARRILIDKQLYKDPGLSLTRLARRVGVPDRDLSRAINQHTGSNVSQFVNQVRLFEAARYLATTSEPVTRIQEKVGFLTRSNFYREFQKQFGDAPGTYRKKAQSSSANMSR